MTKTRLLLKDVKLAAKTKWDMIYQQFGIDMPRKNVHSPCPACGGDDRFRYDDRKDDGDYFCNGCGGGDGFKLVEKCTGMKLSKVIDEVAAIVGLSDTSNITDADRARWRHEAELREKQRLEEVARIQENIAAKSRRQWAAKYGDTASPYLERKQVKNFNCKVKSNGDLIVPAMDAAGKIWNIQTIPAFADKYFNPEEGGRVKGCFFLIGAVELLPADQVICIAEGYATAASIHMATGYPVAVAFTANNLPAVGEAIRDLYPSALLLYCADDDSAKEDTGWKYANKALAVTGGIAVKPVFELSPEHQAQLDSDKQPQASTLTDFNDLHIAHGLDAVRDQVNAAIDSCPVPAPFPAPLSTANSQNQGQGSGNEQIADTVKDALSMQPAGGQKTLAEVGGSGGEESQVFDLSKCLGRFCMIEGESKYWDSHRKKVIKKTAFIDMLGKPLFNDWNSHRDRRMIDMDAVKKATQEISEQGANDLIERFVMLEGTLESFDLMRRQRVKNATIKENFSQGFDTWLKSERKQMIWHEDLVFDPTQRTREKQINMFEGLPVKPLELSQQSINEKCYGIRELLKHLCEEDIEITDWVLKWLALPLQQPGAKMATALLFHGHIQGAGKSLFFGKVMRAIYGKYSATLGQNQLDADYNDWASQNLYTVFEEIFNNQTRYKTMGGVKHLVTGDTIRIDKKFMNGWEESNHINFVFLSNEVQPLPLEENDRRFMVAWPESKLPEEIKQMAVEQANNPESIEAFYTYLLNYNMGDFTTNTEPPMTRSKQRIIDFGLPNWKTFFYQWRDGLTPYPYCSCLSNDLFTAYKRWCTAQNEKQLTLTKFSTNLSTVETIRKKLEWHIADNKRKQGTCILTGDPPGNDPNLTKEKWLTGQIEQFRASIKGQYDDDIPRQL